MPFTPMDDDLAESGDLISVELFSGIATNVNFLIDSSPVGSIIQILSGVTGVPTPDATIWQECDGSAITNEDSPIRGQNTPDLSGKYLRGYSSTGQIGNVGGSNTKNLSHSHSGFTGVTPAPAQCDRDSDFWTSAAHSHTIGSDLSSVNFEPAHVRILHYIKIK